MGTEEHATPENVTPGQPASEPVDDTQLVAGTTLTRVAAGLAAFCGLIVALTGLQTAGVRSYDYAIVEYLPYVIMVFGVLLIVLAVRVHRARILGTMAATGVAGFLALAMGGWLVYGLMNGLFSCFSFITPVLSLLTTGLCAAAIPSAKRASEARKRLSDQGIELGF